jgi:hypothetical protein
MTWQAFRVRLPALWRQAFPGLMAGAVTARLLDVLQGRAFSWPQTLPLMVVAAVMVVSLHLLLPLRAGPRGLKALNVWGWPRHVAWEEVVEARLARVMWLYPSIRLSDTRGRSLWISLDTQNLAGLHALARTHGGAAHPLTRVLETPLHALWG